MKLAHHLYCACFDKAISRIKYPHYLLTRINPDCVLVAAHVPYGKMMAYICISKSPADTQNCRMVGSALSLSHRTNRGKLASNQLKQAFQKKKNITLLIMIYLYCTFTSYFFIISQFLLLFSSYYKY